MVFFFFKQKTAYEMRISDWSSDVCSSDLKDLGKMQGIGHNFLPLHERIFSDPEVSVEDVLMAVSTHLEISHKTNLEQLASTSTMLASNKDRIPEDLDRNSTRLNSSH